MQRRPSSTRPTVARFLLAPALLGALALGACSGGDAGSTSTTTATEPAATGQAATGQAAAGTSAAAASAAATSHPAVTVGVLDKAVAEARRAPALQKASDADVRGWLKAACAAHLAGVPDAQVPGALAPDMRALGGQAEAGAAAVVPVGRKLLCP